MKSGLTNNLKEIDMKDKEQLSLQEKRMITINGGYALASAMTAVFVNVYLCAYTGSLVTMTMYTMIRFAFFPFAFYLGAHIGRKYRLGISLTAGLLLIVSGLLVLLTLKEEIAQFPTLIYLIGSIFGLGEGLFWLSVVSLNQLVTRKETRSHYIGVVGIFNGMSQIAAPLVASMIVRYSSTDIDGYIRIFQAVMVVYVLISVVSLKIMVPMNQQPFTLTSKVVHIKDKQWKYVMNSHWLFGMRDSLVLTLSGLLIYRATGGSGSIYGQLLAVFAFLNISAYMVAGKVITRKNRMNSYRLGSLFVSVSTIVLVVFPNIYGAIAFGLFASLATPFYVNPFQIITMNAMSDYMENENILGYVIAKEIAITLGRVMGMSTILVFSWVFSEQLFLPLSVVFCSLFPVYLTLYASAYHKQRELHRGVN